MKKFTSKIIKPTTKIIITLFATLGIMHTSFAESSLLPWQTSQPSCKSEITCTGSCTLYNVVQTLSAIHCKTMDMMDKEILHIIDDLVKSTLIPNNTDLLKSQQDVNNAVNTSTSNLVSYYLTGMDIRDLDEDALAFKPAEDSSGDKPKDLNKADNLKEHDTYSPYVFGAIDKEKTTAMMNFDTLLGPVQYDTSEKNNQKGDAQTLLRIIETIAPLPDIIRISGNKFTIPYTQDAQSETGTTPIDLSTGKDGIKLSESTAKEKAEKLIQTVNGDPAYRRYKENYRSAIVLRTMILNNLLRSYQERVAPPNGKSQAALDYESATWRLDPKKGYYDKMKDVSPTIVAREMLFLMTEIRYELYQLRQQNEQMIALQSVLGLQMANINKLDNAAQAKEAAKAIYCAAVDNTPCERKQPASEQAPESAVGSATETQGNAPTK